ncbi:GH92 family glycosyl hydrolase [Prevotella sp. kh1p2]|uniref:GH92 family glycosyl hydrolase n=1 Tax=Prevotella sp. kh1p2 TaxID=1761883 RepID=UPI0008AC9D89|nr:GH92 family glycosyl hydrolase [Prevotella sp. kh1p2]SES86837.1 alpha-1,2-mannosidase, putative [Prevotella sp. kh1p2]SNU11114.1 alpha-1,2-mannosidase, putative [Prevotellaceae bacterium KH2P17]
MKLNQLLGTAAFVLSMLTVQPLSAQQKQPVDYVNPYIGNISHLLVPTFATVQLPNSMLRVYPARADYTTELVNGLPVIVTNHRERSAFSITPYQGQQLQPVVPMNYDHEKITPYGFDIELNDNQLAAHYALSHQSAMYTLDFRQGQPVYVLINSQKGAIAISGNSVSGYQEVYGNTRVYLYAETEQQPVESGILKDGHMSADKQARGDNSCAVLRFADGTGHVNLRYGVSFISEEQARKNLYREQQGYNLQKLLADGRAEWNTTLSAIDVEGGSDNQRTVLYTSYYRTFERPICMSEDGRYWSAYDGKVHADGGRPFYTDDWIWDTYRAAHPLRALIQPRKEEDIIESYLLMAEQMGTGWLPTFPEVSGDSRRMNSNHGVAMIADALYKGLKVDAKRGFEYSRKALEEKTLAPWSGKPAGWIDSFYKQHGYIPALREGEAETDPNVSSFEKRQPVAVTLGTSYDEWALSRIAAFMGKKKEAARYAALGYNYRNLFNPQTAFFHPKDSEGRFLEPFDYRFSGGVGVRDTYDENNGWTYRWDVQHNVADLISLMGGREQFVRNLNQTFAEPMGRGKREFYTQLPDQTGNIGQFTMANEPSLHIPYLYNYAGQPWMTQKRVRQVLKTWFRNDVMGIPGDEDGGGLTAFAVFSSIGFYPVTPGFPAYNIGSPLFSRIKVRLGNGRILEIVANGNSDENKYIQSATLNGKPWNKPWFSHDDIKDGATLVLQMGRHPNKEWGADAQAAPPSAGVK